MTIFPTDCSTGRLIRGPKAGKFGRVSTKETEKANIFLDQKESADALREVSILSKLADEPDWESLVKKEMFKWVILYGGAILLVAAVVAGLVFGFSRGR